MPAPSGDVVAARGRDGCRAYTFAEHVQTPAQTQCGATISGTDGDIRKKYWSAAFTRCAQHQAHRYPHFQAPLLPPRGLDIRNSPREAVVRHGTRSRFRFFSILNACANGVPSFSPVFSIPTSESLMPACGPLNLISWLPVSSRPE